MMKPIRLAPLVIVAACGTATGPARGLYATTVEGIRMEIAAEVATARVTATEVGTPTGASRRAVLSEIEVAARTRCQNVSLINQSSQTSGDTTVSTLDFALGSCPPVASR